VSISLSFQDLTWDKQMSDDRQTKTEGSYTYSVCEPNNLVTNSIYTLA